MGIVLIIISFLALLIHLSPVDTETGSFREALLKTSIVHGLLIAISTELLGTYQLLASIWIHLLWTLIAAVNTGWLFYCISHKKGHLNLSAFFKNQNNHYAAYSGVEKLAALSIITTITICLFTALLAPPNNYDSMTYHMPRVMHWIQNQSVEHYPTHNLRQISFPPGAAYIVTHFQVLTGNDRFANIVQWAAFFGCILGTSLLSLSFNRREDQLVTALVCASIPMAIMQSTTTQTDLTVSFWLVCFVYFIFRTKYYSRVDFVWITASLGLAMLTKPTAAIFSLPFIILLGVRIIGGFADMRNISVLIRGIFITFMVPISALFLSFPSYWRNFQTFGSFLGVDNGTRVDSIGLDVLFSNVLRNTALNMPVEGFWIFVGNLHEWFLGLDVNAPGTTFAGIVFNTNFLHRFLIPDEDFVGSPIHMILILVSITAVFTSIYLRKEKTISDQVGLILCSLFGFFLFCLLIKWQTWANRLILPLFILNSPIVGFFINRYTSKSITFFIIALLSLSAAFYSLTPIHHPIIALPQRWTHHSQSDSILRLKREDIYHSSYGKQIKSAYVSLSNHALMKNCRFLGLDIGDDDGEYPIWVSLSSKGLDSFKIKHVNVHNPSLKAMNEFPDSKVCVLFKKNGHRIRIYSR